MTHDGPRRIGEVRMESGAEFLFLEDFISYRGSKLLGLKLDVSRPVHIIRYSQLQRRSIESFIPLLVNNLPQRQEYRSSLKSLRADKLGRSSGNTLLRQLQEDHKQWLEHLLSSVLMQGSRATTCSRCPASCRQLPPGSNEAGHTLLGRQLISPESRELHCHQPTLRGVVLDESTTGIHL